MDGQEAACAAEQPLVDAMYDTLDAMREQADGSLASVLRGPTAGTPQGVGEREALVGFYDRRRAGLQGVEERLCFGRLDLRDGIRRYVGRIGLPGEGTEPLLVDWRAPAAAPFYRATPASPGDVVRRRHLTLADRTVVAVEDEALDIEAMAEADRTTLVGEGALMAAVGAARTGRMGDIVATIQAEQDRIVRADLSGTLVVQGGPGTGKTAVALHRVAYLMYTHRERLERSGVLLVGPSPVFLRYIERVLPALGESGTVMRTPGTLFPGVRAVAHDPDPVARIKSDLRMVDVLARSVAQRQRVPREPVTLDVDGVTLTVQPQMFERARQRARSGGRPHNEARTTFVKAMLDLLAERLARASGIDLRLDGDARLDLITDLRDSIDVRRAINLAWMPLTPERVLAQLYANPELLADAGRALSADERALMRRDRLVADAWTIEDVPLLDELAELLGDDDEAERLAGLRADRERKAELAGARASLRTTGGAAAGIVTAEMLVDRDDDRGPRLSVAEHAERDRGWVFGHVVVDEAQELSPMQWRVLVRRCPSRSMTIVGDVAQTGAPSGTRRWADTLDAFVADRWRQEELTVNYRTPRRIVEIAERTARRQGLDVGNQETVREGEHPPTFLDASSLDAVVHAVKESLATTGHGRIAVIAPARGPRSTALIAQALRDQLGAEWVGTGSGALEAAVAVLDPTESKGLEVDAVLLIDPQRVLEDGERHGAGDLFVAMTRATQSLVVIYDGQLPVGMLEGSSAG